MSDLGWGRLRDGTRGMLAGFVLAGRIYAPERLDAPETPADRGLAFEERSWRTTRDGLRVSAWWVPGTGTDAVLVCHGMGKSKAAVLDHIAMLHGAGFHVLAVDNRNHGETQGGRRRWNMATRFSTDLADAVAQLRREPGVTGRLSVLAFSFSCWPAVRAARRDGVAIDAVVCDSGPVLDIGTAVQRLARLQSMRLPDWAHGGAGLSALSSSARFWMLLALAERHWPPVSAEPPVLLIAGGRDRLLPAEEVRALGAALPGSELWVVPAAGHLRALATEPEAYAERVVTFLRRSSVPATSANSVNALTGEAGSRG